jgi:iron-sulfur cluster repair protein YtfE (RIC family)
MEVAVTTVKPSETARPDTREMVIVHNVFRRLFGDLPGLIRAVPDGDVARAAIVCGAVDELAGGLHHHHTTEDELLWPVLLERVELERSFVLRAEEQHERLHELLELVSVQVVPFRASARAADRDALATTLAELDAALREHMADEERDILPLVETHLSVAEWEAMGERARSGIPKDRMLVQLGWILDGLSPDERRAFLRNMPFAARIAWRLIGRRTWAKDRDRVYGIA